MQAAVERCHALRQVRDALLPSLEVRALLLEPGVELGAPLTLSRGAGVEIAVHEEPAEPSSISSASTSAGEVSNDIGSDTLAGHAIREEAPVYIRSRVGVDEESAIAWCMQ